MATATIIILLLSLAAPSLISCSWPSDFLCGVWLLHFLWAHAHSNAVIGHQNFAAAVKMVVEPMGKTSLVLDMVDMQEHDSG